MKLYTEEQVRQAIAIGYDWCHQKYVPSDDMINVFIKELTPIELPTDKEIQDSLHPEDNPEQELYNDGWEDGIKWLRNKIQGGNK